MVLLPDHLHTVWSLPPTDADYSGRWRTIKARFTRALVRQGVPLVRNSRGEYDVWQRRFWEHVIRDDGDFARHVDYIHHNPVKHGLVATRSIGVGRRSITIFVVALSLPIAAGISRMGRFGD